MDRKVVGQDLQVEQKGGGGGSRKVVGGVKTGQHKNKFFSLKGETKT